MPSISIDGDSKTLLDWPCSNTKGLTARYPKKMQEYSKKRHGLLLKSEE